MAPIQSTLVAKFENNYNDQTSSPLYTLVPNEIRNTIFGYCLKPTYDLSRPYNPIGYVSRPGYRYPLKVDTTLLQTCRLVYLEGHQLPVDILKEHTLWRHRGPANEGAREFNWEEFLNQAEEELEWQRDIVERVVLFTQLYWLESDFSEVTGESALKAKTLKVVIRHHDWWNWESNTPLALENGWTEDLASAETLEEFILELETMERDKDQMLAIANNCRDWKIEFSNERTATATQHPLLTWKWDGPAAFQDSPDDDYALTYDKEQNHWDYVSVSEEGKIDSKTATGMVYWVAQIRWTVQPSDE
ncbi:hypothetical protein DL96DRAFT_107858 [Flagelloscypha sp. PMI_526]|nr:hypothetical protein DL96DRAFT_107858 [Flagelloscypha sp. PMI_526]